MVQGETHGVVNGVVNGAGNGGWYLASESVPSGFY